MNSILSDPELESQIGSFTLLPSEGGRFEFSVDGNLLYSKLETKRHTEEGELNQILKKYIAGKKQ